MDRINDRRGRSLMAQMREANLRVLNGRCNGDAQGNYTYKARGARSVLDYVFVSALDEANMRVVSDFLAASDHALVLYKLTIKKVSLYTLNAITPAPHVPIVSTVGNSE